MNGVITSGDISVTEIGLAYLYIIMIQNIMEYRS